MKTFSQSIDSATSGWEKDPYGFVVKLPDNVGGSYEVRIEPLLFGQFAVAVYREGDMGPELVANKVPVKPGGGGQET